MSAAQVEAAHGKGCDTEPKRQRNEFCRRWMVLVPSDGRTSSQKDKKEGCDQLNQSTGPEMKTLQLRHDHHLGTLFAFLFAKIQPFSALALISGLGVLLCYLLLTRRLCVALGHLSW